MSGGCGEYCSASRKKIFRELQNFCFVCVSHSVEKCTRLLGGRPVAFYLGHHRRGHHSGMWATLTSSSEQKLIFITAGVDEVLASTVTSDKGFTVGNQGIPCHASRWTRLSYVPPSKGLVYVVHTRCANRHAGNKHVLSYVPMSRCKVFVRTREAMSANATASSSGTAGGGEGGGGGSSGTDGGTAGGDAGGGGAGYDNPSSITTGGGGASDNAGGITTGGGGGGTGRGTRGSTTGSDSGGGSARQQTEGGERGQTPNCGLVGKPLATPHVSTWPDWDTFI